jgi:hypothetical protein
MIIVPGDAVTHATVIDADVACGAGDSEVEITEVADTEVAVSSFAIEPLRYDDRMVASAYSCWHQSATHFRTHVPLLGFVWAGVMVIRPRWR